MFNPIVPSIAVIGGKSSGKTSAVEVIVQALKKRKLTSMTVKHVSQSDFSVDKKGTDTWRHWKAGAEIVSTVSNLEKAIMIRNGGDLNFNDFNIWAKNVDVTIFEGFSYSLLREEKVGKVICLRDKSEKDNYLVNLKGPLIALCSLRVLEKDILRLGLDDNILAERVFEFCETI
ncbi:molybdopterin-guanine dinucleotide biosynthesis protein B [Candidatus Bathyarchaeota archaeon]|nr:molybdopterin-guanine dinucleotide biosynthesis protein B [Candidatus Bathyarchaeota archaeon]